MGKPTKRKPKFAKVFLNYNVFVSDKPNKDGVRQVQIVAETSYAPLSLEFAKCMSSSCAEFVASLEVKEAPRQRQRVMGFYMDDEEDTIDMGKGYDKK